MGQFPTSIDTLIQYVEQLHPDDSPLEYVAEARAVSTRLADQADELLGHFVSRARRSGHSWTEIGSQLGVSKQAVRKRFIPKWDGSDPIPADNTYSRFTLYARRAMLAAHATALKSGAGRVDTNMLAAGLLSEPDGLAARIIAGRGISTQDVYHALGTAATPCDLEPTAANLGRVTLTDTATAALESTRAATNRLGHNYIGTEHILLGIVSADNPTAETLHILGVTASFVESAINDAITRIQSESEVAVNESWDSIADWYSALVRDGSPMHRFARDILVSALPPTLTGMDVIDVGCGEGLITRALASRGADALGIDPTVALIEHARDAERTQPVGARYRQDDGAALSSIPDDAADWITAGLSLNNIADLDSALRSFRRVLKSAGRVVFTVPHPCFDAPRCGSVSVGGTARRTVGDYFAEGLWRTTDSHSVRRAGNYHRTITTYVSALRGNGFALELLAEPAPNEQIRETHPHRAGLPPFLLIRAVTA